ncbi:terpene cyclase/mutase family protein [Actinokineospora auranticolor]|uniref:prenyltransferase/squalene oxidase repeat-containing protein n=1 Tax=Actinokineospora auranticolor TaxID=155976 RepID=UPI0015E409DA|nr:prenyltransferase/squalene oxidase repeat-containing protein [Actinokineospora auranticolor]
MFAVAVTVTATAPAQAAVTADDTAAGWLARQLVDGEYIDTPGVPGMPDHGLTADVVLALDAAGVAKGAAEKATAFLAVPANATYYAFPGGGESYVGPLAKLGLVAQAQGIDPKTFGGIDLHARLLALMDARTGRFADATKYGDQTSTFSQALAVLTLKRAGELPDLAVDYLAGAACPDGGFPVPFEEATCLPDVDGTAITVQALLAAGRAQPATKGLDWLVANQRPNGSFLDGGIENSNSTGLAAQALRAGGRTAEADKAVAFLVTLQVGCDRPEADRGAIPHNASEFDAATAARAAAQAIPGIAGVSFADITADGATAALPTVDCPTPTTTTTAPTTTTTTASGTTTTTSAAAPLPAGSRTPPLAATGFQPTAGVWVGVLLLLTGTGLVLVSRRRVPHGGNK